MQRKQDTAQHGYCSAIFLLLTIQEQRFFKIMVTKKTAKKATAKTSKKPEPKAKAKPDLKKAAKHKPAGKTKSAAKPVKSDIASKNSSAKPLLAKVVPAKDAVIKAATAKMTTPAAVSAVAQKPVQQPPKALVFKVGELVVYPAHGVGRVSNIEVQEIAGTKLELYIVDFDKEKLRLKVPTNRAEQKGMRHLADRSMIEQAMKVIRGRARIKRVMWSRRAQEYDAKINSGDLIAVAEVVRDLYRSERQPEQSYSERQLFEQALARFARELAAVRKIDDDQCIRELDEFLARNAKRSAAEKPDEEAAEEAA
jgi:CarD family transcriptional regulator